MRNFEFPEMSVIRFNVSDIITSSIGDELPAVPFSNDDELTIVDLG